MAEPQRILIVRPSALGDVCRTVPVLVTLRSAFPRATIDWVVQEDFVEAISSHPDLDEAICFPRNDFARWWRNPAMLVRIWSWIADLRRRRYDVVFDCQGLGRSGMITLATGARRRVGRRTARELAWLGYNVRHPPSPGTHSVPKMMALLVAEGLQPVYDMRLYVADRDRAWWARQRELGISGQRYVALAATSRWQSKRWPVESWSALIDPLRKRGYERVVLVGGPSEQAQVAAIVNGGSSMIVDLVGRTSVGQTMAIVEGASLVIANDSAPLHVAVGLSRPCIGLYGPTDPALEGPFSLDGTSIRIIRSVPRRSVRFKDPRLGDVLMRSIRPADVLDVVDQLSEDRTAQIAGGLTVGGPVGMAAASEVRP